MIQDEETESQIQTSWKKNRRSLPNRLSCRLSRVSIPPSRLRFCCSGWPKHTHGRHLRLSQMDEGAQSSLPVMGIEGSVCAGNVRLSVFKSWSIVLGYLPNLREYIPDGPGVLEAAVHRFGLLVAAQVDSYLRRRNRQCEQDKHQHHEDGEQDEAFLLSSARS